MKLTEWPAAKADPCGHNSYGLSQFFRDSYRRMVNRYLPRLISSLLALLFSLTFITLPRSAHAKETLTWLLHDLPPLTIFAGPQTGQGAIDRLMPELIARMPEYEHKIMHVNRARGTLMLQDPAVFACDPALLWTPEREKHILFSIPIYAVPANGVTIRRSNHQLFAPFISADGRIDMVALLTSKTLKVGIVAERSYGAVIDNALQGAAQPDSLIVHYGNIAVGSMLQMERLERFQAILSYWPEVSYHAQQQGIPLDELEFFPVRGSPKYQFAHIGCSKTNKGRVALERINHEMRVLRTTKLIPFYSEWMVNSHEYLRDAGRFFEASEQ